MELHIEEDLINDWEYNGSPSSIEFDIKGNHKFSSFKVIVLCDWKTFFIFNEWWKNKDDKRMFSL